MPDYIDIHSHVHFAAFDADRDEVTKRALAENVWMINVGTQKDTSKSAIELAEKYDSGVYATVGLHPIHTDKSYHDKMELGEGSKEFTSRGEHYDISLYHSMAKDLKVVAIGEAGLDYFHMTRTGSASPSILKSSGLNGSLQIGADQTRLPADLRSARRPPEPLRRRATGGFGEARALAQVGTDAENLIRKQTEVFRKQVELAIEVQKPLMLHMRSSKNRSAYEDALSILKSYTVNYKSLQANFHFFAGSWEEAKEILDAGFYLSFTGVITFARDYDEVIKNAPLERIMTETDCPYVAPLPFRGKRNEPLYVKEIVKKIAEIRGEDFEKVKNALVKNAIKFFKIKT